uniref:Formin-like protein 20 n=1 Tax=Castor canadensis TaxID=51338 RepID=A0A8B7U840_CASCN|nr:formin-like protein 20 [Castor canadensis]XP_020015631.1 formin-like protein 20 [Castor canadensis]
MADGAQTAPWLSAPRLQPAVPGVARRASERAGGRVPPPRGERERGGRGRERGREGGSARAAAVAAAGGGGEQARRAAAAPLALQSHTPGSPTQAPPPHCPAIFSGLYRRLFRQARRPPPPRNARQPAAKASARPARPPPPPPPSAHGKAPLQAPPPRLAALTPTPRAALARLEGPLLPQHTGSPSEEQHGGKIINMAGFPSGT